MTELRDKLRQRLYVADPNADLGNYHQLAAVAPFSIKQVDV